MLKFVNTDKVISEAGHNELATIRQEMVVGEDKNCYETIEAFIEFLVMIGYRESTVEKCFVKAVQDYYPETL